nr:subclass B1 metallo-beta-lactamase [Alteriqipengyuania halimionae]
MRRVAALAALLALSACYSMPKDAYRATDSAVIESTVEFGEVTLSKISDTVWMHTSSLSLPGYGPVSSNGLIVLREDEAILVDTAWTDGQTEDILRYAAVVLDRPVRTAVITHFHQDKMGGIGALHRAGIETWAHPLTNELAPTIGFEPARHAIAFGSDGFATGEAAQALGPLRVFYPGPGHTRDNITVGLPGEGFAFGGCLIKGAKSPSLGNLGDADVDYYATAARNFAEAFPDARTILMSHSAPATRKAIERTIRMAEKARR